MDLNDKQEKILDGFKYSLKKIWVEFDRIERPNEKQIETVNELATDLAVETGQKFLDSGLDKDSMFRKIVGGARSVGSEMKELRFNKTGRSDTHVLAFTVTQARLKALEPTNKQHGIS